MMIAYVNGRYVDSKSASVLIEDRGFQFGDSVYEVIPFVMGRMIDEEAHMERLGRSIKELSMRLPVSLDVLPLLCREVLIKNGQARGATRDGIIYIQVTRGVAPRNHAFPNGELKRGLIITWKEMVFRQNTGILVYTAKDNRWGRCDIKTTNLLANCMAKTSAKTRGGDESWLVDTQGCVSEGSSSNAWIVKGDKIITRHWDHGILGGVTRASVLNLATSESYKVEERGFSVEEAYNADEAFATSAGLMVSAVVRIDDKTIGGGDFLKWRMVPKLQALYRNKVEQTSKLAF